MSRHASDLTVKEFGRLRPLENLGQDRYGNYLWKCQCSCADRTILVVRARDLFSKSKTNCGCLRNEWQARVRSPLRKRAEEMRKSGSTYGEIAKALGISRQRAHQMIKESQSGQE